MKNDQTISLIWNELRPRSSSRRETGTTACSAVMSSLGADPGRVDSVRAVAAAMSMLCRLQPREKRARRCDHHRGPLPATAAACRRLATPLGLCNDEPATPGERGLSEGSLMGSGFRGAARAALALAIVASTAGIASAQTYGFATLPPGTLNHTTASAVAKVLKEKAGLNVLV